MSHSALLVGLGLLSALITYGATFVVRRVALAKGAVVVPDARKVHDRPTPTLGGAAMLLAFLISMTLAWRIPQLHGIFANSSGPLGVMLAAVLIFAVGMVDDLREVSPPAKVAGQVLAATVLYYAGDTMYSVKIPLVNQIFVLSPSVTPLLTALWVVGIANAINLIDGLDGLAAGIVAIAAGSFALYSVMLQHLGLLSADSMGPLVAAITAGACIGFLPHNFHPAKIFMGDAGALTLGLLMAASTSVVGGRTPDVSGHTYFFFVPLVIPLFILGVPMTDTFLAVVRRTARRSGVATADKAHLHHRLMQMGHGHRRSVLILWAWTAILSGFVLYPLVFSHGNGLVPALVMAAGISLYTAFWPRRHHGRHGRGLHSRKSVAHPGSGGASEARDRLASARSQADATPAKR